MSASYQIIGAENSPYSIKVRSYFRFKGIPHEWLRRSEAAEVYERLAKLPLVPLVATPDGRGLQDSTPIIEKMEQEHPTPALDPADPTLGFLSALLEEWGDEWGNKWMFHYRWARPADQIAASKRLVADGGGTQTGAALDAIAASVRERMVPRVWFVGSNDQTAPLIERSFQAMLVLLDAHLAQHPFLLGARPSLADLGLWGQIYNAAKDPTPQALILPYANVGRWLDALVDPTPSDEPFASYDALAPTLAPLLSEHIGKDFLPWSDANAQAIASGAEEFDVALGIGAWTQKPQKYHARSLAALRSKYAQVADVAELKTILTDTHCLRWLTA